MDSPDYAQDITVDGQSSNGSPEGFAPSSPFGAAFRASAASPFETTFHDPQGPDESNFTTDSPSQAPTSSEGDALQAPPPSSQPASQDPEGFAPTSPFGPTFHTAGEPDWVFDSTDASQLRPNSPFYYEGHAVLPGSQALSQESDLLSPTARFWTNFHAAHPYFPDHSSDGGDAQTPPPSSQPASWDSDFYLVMAPTSVKVGEEFKIILGSELPEEFDCENIAALENFETRIVSAFSHLTADSKNGSFTFTGVFDPENSYDGHADLEFSLYRDYPDGASACVGAMLVTMEVEQ
jgi:hypothetical protein